MAVGSTSLLNFLVVLLIGIIVGVLLNRYIRIWLARLAGTSHTDGTAAFVGIAGAFIGFHLSIILGLLPSPLMHFMAAKASAAASGCVGEAEMRRQADALGR